MGVTSIIDSNLAVLDGRDHLLTLETIFSPRPQRTKSEPAISVLPLQSPVEPRSVDGAGMVMRADVRTEWLPQPGMAHLAYSEEAVVYGFITVGR